MNPNSKQRLKKSRQRLTIVATTFWLLVLASAAQGAWLVYDRRVETAVNDVKTEVTSVKNEVKKFREQSQPQWNSGGNSGTYNPFTGRTQQYDTLDNVTRSADQGMRTKCGAVHSFTGTDVWAIPDIPDTEINSAQLSAYRTEVCQRIVSAENLRFDQILKVMQRIKQRNEALKTLAQNRSSIEEGGQLDANTNNLQMFTADSQVEIQYMQATVVAYDSLVVSLKQSQDLVGDRALNGKETTGEQFTRLAALTTAIQAVQLF